MKQSPYKENLIKLWCRIIATYWVYLKENTKVLTFLVVNNIQSNPVKSDTEGGHRKCPYSINRVSILNRLNFKKMLLCYGSLSPGAKQTDRNNEVSLVLSECL